MAKRLNTVETIRINTRDRDLSYRWYRNQVKELTLSKVQLRNDIRNQAILSTNITIGKLYLFTYDPKWKDVLPVYDTYPLVFPFNYAKGGFLGINLHYLPYGFRFFLIEALAPYLQANNPMREIDRLRLSWRILNRVAGVGSLNDAVKHYLLSHVKSSFMEIKYLDWKTASTLPVQNFIKK